MNDSAPCSVPAWTMRVGIEEKQEIARRFAAPRLQAAAKPRLAGFSIRRTAGNSRRTKLGAAIAGGVVHDDDLEGKGRGMPVYRRQAGAQEFARVPADDDDAQTDHAPPRNSGRPSMRPVGVRSQEFEHGRRQVDHPPLAAGALAGQFPAPGR